MDALAMALAAAALLLNAGAIAAVVTLETRRRRQPRSELEGRLVLVNTPKPDDQSIRGVCIRELEGGALVLAAAVYLERDVERGQEVLREVPAGDVVVPAYSWLQIDPTPTTTTER